MAGVASMSKFFRSQFMKWFGSCGKALILPAGTLSRCRKLGVEYARPRPSSGRGSTTMIRLSAAFRFRWYAVSAPLTPPPMATVLAVPCVEYIAISMTSTVGRSRSGWNSLILIRYKPNLDPGTRPKGGLYGITTSTWTQPPVLPQTGFR